MQDTFALTDKDVILQKTTTTFDVSVWELVWWYFAGASVHMLDPGAEKDPARLVAAIDKAKVTTLHFVPSMMGAFLEYLEANADEVERCATLRRVVTSGETLSREMVERFNSLLRPLGTELHNLYGPTEATIDVSWYPCPAVTPEIIPIGKPVANTQLYILDAFGNPQPVGVPGELCIGGVQVARGYLNRPELNAEKFINNPFAEGRLYKTGDLARWLEDGNIEYLGRIDQQVKIRGFRIELGEIESALREHASVKEAIVNPFGDRGEQRLCAYIVGDFDATELRRHLAATLPDYMVPSAFVKLDSLPLTPSGKADRKNLPDPHLGAQAAYTAPRSDGEKILCSLFEEILGVERVGIHDNFFELGGHSLLATRLINAASKVFAAEIPLKTIFDQPTPARFQEAIRSGSTAAAPPIRKTGQAEAPLSFAQSRLWFLDQFEEGSTAYNIPAAFRIQGDLDIEALEKSLAFLIRRHGSLRTVFTKNDQGEAFQRVVDLGDFSLTLESLSGSEIPAELRSEAQQPFDLQQGPLYSFRLFQINEQDHVLSLTLHHIVFDGWSFGIFLKELGDCYAAYTCGKEPELTEIPAEYSDYSQWQREWLAGERLEEQSAFWKEQLRDIPELLALPTDQPRPEIQSTRGGHVPLEIDADTTRALMGIARERNVTLFMALETLWALFLAKYSGMDDIVVGTPVSGRTRPEIENTIGFFVNTLPLRHDFSGTPTFNDLLDRTRRVALQAYVNQDIPFEKLVDELSPTRNTSHSPIFQAMFAFADESFEKIHLDSLDIRPLFPEYDIAKFDLTLNLGTWGESLGGNLEYCSDLFERQTAERMAGHFRHLAEQITNNPGLAISDISLLDQPGYDLVTKGFNATDASFPEDRVLHSLFEQQVEKNPQAIAVRDHQTELTYAELNTRANRIAHALIDKGVKPDTLVGLCLERSVDLIAAIFGIHKAAGGYVPLDPHYPADRLNYMIKDAGLRFLVTTSDNSLSFDGEVLHLDKPETWQNHPASNPKNRTLPTDTAYVIYTSGSTGKPKGVVVEHRNVVQLLFQDRLQFTFGPKDVWTMFHSYAFDFSVWEIFGSLLYGGRLVVVDPATAKDPEAFLELLKKEKVTVLNQVPSYFTQLNAAAGRAPEKELAVRYLVFGGEAFYPHIVKDWKKRYPSTQIVNMYGITETTVHVTYKEIGEQEIAQGISNIGTQLAPLSVYILDPHGRPQPLGIPGEIHVGGAGVARGYLNRPELTAERFVPNPFGEGRLYRTGDLGRRLSGGSIEYLGRIDHQVKIRGFRIELGEIESALRDHPSVEDVIVNPFGDRGGQRLCAYIVGDFDIEELRAHLSAELPDYMVPAAFMGIEAIPMTPSGKADRKALPDPELTAVGAYTPPQTGTEKALCVIFAEVLGVERSGIHDNFFASGGDSILALQIVARARSKGFDLAVRDIFKSPDVAGLATRARALRSIWGVIPEPEAPLTPIHSLESEGAYQVQVRFRVEGNFDPERFHAAWQQAVDRHEALRMAIPEGIRPSWSSTAGLTPLPVRRLE